MTETPDDELLLERLMHAAINGARAGVEQWMDRHPGREAMISFSCDGERIVIEVAPVGPL